MTDRIEQRAHDALADNFADRVENGPGLRFSTKTAAIAKCPAGVHVLRTGLGAMGVGTMWCPTRQDDVDDEMWAELPVEDCNGKRAFGPACPVEKK